MDAHALSHRRLGPYFNLIGVQYFIYPNRSLPPKLR
jgi:hypothetical protein